MRSDIFVLLFLSIKFGNLTIVSSKNLKKEEILNASSYLAQISLDEEFVCTGTILNENWIVTVSQCNISNYENTESKLGITFGYYEPHPETRLVVELHDLESYGIPEAGLVMLKMDKKIEFLRNIQSVKMTEPSLDRNTARHITFVGFKRNNTDELGDPKLIARRYARFKMKSFPNTKSSELCVTSKQVKNICEFSDGSLMLQNNKLIGILTKISCKQKKGYALFIKSNFTQKIVEAFIDAFEENKSDTVEANDDGKAKFETVAIVDKIPFPMPEKSRILKFLKEVESKVRGFTKTFTNEVKNFFGK